MVGFVSRAAAGVAGGAAAADDKHQRVPAVSDRGKDEHVSVRAG